MGAWEALLKWGREAMAFGNRLLAKVITVRLIKLTFVRRAKVKYMLRIVQFVNRLKPSTGFC